MYFWNSYPFVRLTIILILGILTSKAFPQLFEFDLTIIGLVGALLAISLFISYKVGFYRLRHVNGLLTIMSIFLIGGIIAVTDTTFARCHYTKSPDPVKGYVGIINSPPTERTNYFRYDLKLQSTISKKDSVNSCSGLIHLYIRKDSLNHLLDYGDRIMVHGSMYQVPAPDNPNEFDYRSYLEKQHIFSHSFVDYKDIRKLGLAPENEFLAIAFSLRQQASDIIDKHIPNSRENGIAKALLIGIKDDLDNDIKKAYSAAGAMHVLAVSGLHVGIVFLMIQLVFGKLKNLGKWGTYVFVLLSLSIIWIYAALTGLSPSVLRAATMFSFITLAAFGGSRGNVYNTLGLSAFVLIAINPNLIYSVGFQLSYAAVVGIVYIQPILYRLYQSKYWLIDKAWAITCVSIAAQLATFPLSAYYFHQFPSYFLVSNLLVIPASSFLLVGGVLMLLLDPLVSPISHFLGIALETTIWILNETISWVHLLPNSLIEWIYIDHLSLLLIYVIIITFICSIHFHSFKTIIVSAILLLGLFGWILADHEANRYRQELVFYEIANTVAIDHINGHQSKLYLDRYQHEDLELLSFQIDPHRLASRLNPIRKDLEEIEFWKTHDLSYGIVAGKRVVIFDTTTYHLAFNEIIETDFIVIHNEAVKSLRWLSENFKADQIIISNRNSPYYSRKMKRDAEELNLKLHAMKEDGALRYSLAEGTKKERTSLPAPFTTNPD